MRRLLLPLICTLLCVTAATAQVAKDTPRVWEAPLVIPTYELNPPNPYPALLDWQRRKWRPVYPYAFLDALGSEKKDKAWKAVYLENEYIKVTVLPELGGHVYQIFDKTLNRDIIYSNPVMKYAMVALRGAWVSGGIEWNFPDGHTLTTVAPIDYVVRTEADGSAAVAIGDTERVQGMQWQVILRLRPGTRVLESEVTLNNRRPVPGRYWYWSTAGAPAAPDLRFNYPMREAYPHAFWPVFKFPVEKGVDIGRFSEVPNFLSLFARDSKRDYFGVYYEKSDWGVVHVADHRELPGKKTWTWGTDENGDIWIDKLTDGGGQYVEFQGGRFETQMEHQFIAPHRVEHFFEYWFGVNKMGGAWNEATRDAAVRINLQGSRASISVAANQRFDQVELTLASGEKQVHTERLNLDPAKIYTATIEVPAPRQALVLTLKSRDGRVLLRYRTDSPVDNNPDFKPATRPIPDPKNSTSAEQSYVEGLAFDKKSKERDARAAYTEALKRDPGFAPAHIALGLSFYRSGEFEVARKHLEAALVRNKDAGDAHYYLALVQRELGQTAEAEDHLLWLVRSGYRESLAHYVLGEIALEKGDTKLALEHLGDAVMLDPRDLKARTVLAVAERLDGNLQSALTRINQVVNELPIDYFALREQYLINKAAGNAENAKLAADQLRHLLAREPDAVLELAFDYVAIGRHQEAIDVLEDAIKSGPSGSLAVDKTRIHPMLYYTLGYLYANAGNRERQRDQFALAVKGDPAFVFPHRVEEIEVLRTALAYDRDDGRAAYYLGNVLASKNRDNEALVAWRDAVKLDPANTIAQRNYARALWLVSQKRDEAAAQYQRAIDVSPTDFRLYVEFDKLLAEMSATERRIKLLEGAPASVIAQSPVVQSLAGAYIDAGRFSEAAALLAKTTFTSGEGEDAALGLYRKAHLGLARKYRDAGDHSQAAAEFAAVTEFPRNFGVGRPAMQSQAQYYVAAAREFEAAGKTAEADRWWQRAATEELNPPSQPEEPWSENYYYKAVALEHVGRKAEARKLYERLALLNDDEKMLEAEPWPATGAIRFVLAGAALNALGRHDEARVALERALKLDPQNELAISQLSFLPQKGTKSSNRLFSHAPHERLAQLVEANILAVHAFQVLLAKSSGKGTTCFAPGDLSESALNALSAHQANLLKSDLKQVSAWANGRESTFDPSVDLEPILTSGLKVPDNAPVNTFTRYLRQNTKASDVKIRAVANLYQTVLEVERDGDRLQEEFAFYIGLGLPVYVGQFNLPGTDADLLTTGRKLEGQSCEAPVGTSAAEWQIAGRKIWNWGEKNLHIRDERVLAAELLKEPEVKRLEPRLRALPPQRIAVVGHSFTMGLHWSSPSSFVPIVIDVFRRENPRVEFRQYAAGGLTASRAQKRFYQDVLAWKPDKVMLVVMTRTDEDYEALKQMGQGLRAAGIKTYMFDEVHDPAAVTPGTVERARKTAGEAGIEVIEVGSILANSPERSKFICLDGIHMTEPYHRLMAQEWLKYLAGARGDKAEGAR